jgi:general secretion pathway protein L
MSVLVVTLPAQAEASEVSWAFVDGDEVLAEGVVSPGEAPDLPVGAAPQRAVALMPAEAVFLRRVAVPGGSERDARRAAPFLIEEQLAQPLETVAVEVGPKQADGTRFVLAVDSALRETWRKCAAGLGVKPVQAVPDVMTIQSHGADLAVYALESRILIQTRDGDLHAAPDGAKGERDMEAAASERLFAAVEPELADMVLPSLSAKIRPRRVIVTEGFDPALTAADDAPIALKRVPAPDLRSAAAALPVSAFDRLPSVLGAGLASGFDWAQTLRPWRAAAGLAFAALIGLAGLNALQASVLERRADAYERARQATFQQAFPDTRPVNIDVQLRRRLAAVGAAESGGGFLDLSAALSAILSDVEGVRVDSIRYDAERGGLAVSALYGDFGDFEALRAAAEARDLILDDGGARQSADGVEGEFTVRLP